MKRLWVTDSGIIHHRKPRMDATEYVQVTQTPENVSCDNLTNMNDLKTVRDALMYYKKLHSQHNEDDEIEPDEDGVIAWDAIDTLDRMIETLDPTEKVDLDEITMIAWEAFFSSNKPAPYNQMKDAMQQLINTGRLR